MAQPTTEWRLIETAPKDGTEILVANVGERGYHTELNQIGSAYWVPGSGLGTGWISNACCDGVSRYVPSYWMPLPEPPKES